MAGRTPAPAMPEPRSTWQGFAFGVMYFATEAEADLAGRLVRESGATYNGGWFDGMPCGREPHRDSAKGFAVTY